MNAKFSRRNLIHAAGVAALPFPATAAMMSAHRLEGSDLPKICLEIGPGSLAGGALNEAGARRVKQLGVDHVITRTPGQIPWQEAQLKELIGRLKDHGLTLGNLMIGGFPNTIYGRPGRDEEIAKVIVDSRGRQGGAAGRRIQLRCAPANRRILRRDRQGRAGMTAFDYDRVKDLPPLEKEGPLTRGDVGQCRVLPQGGRSRRRAVGSALAVHPNDPPAPLSRGSGQIMSTLAGWKRLIDIVKSPSNGLTFDCGVTRELGEDPVEVCRYLGARTASTTCITAM